MVRRLLLLLMQMRMLMQKQKVRVDVATAATGSSPLRLRLWPLLMSGVVCYGVLLGRRDEGCVLGVLDFLVVVVADAG